PHRDLHSFPTRRSSDLQKLFEVNASHFFGLEKAFYKNIERDSKRLDILKSDFEADLRTFFYFEVRHTKLGDADTLAKNAYLSWEDRKSTRLNSSHSQIS